MLITTIHTFMPVLAYKVINVIIIPLMDILMKFSKMSCQNKEYLNLCVSILFLFNQGHICPTSLHHIVTES